MTRRTLFASIAALFVGRKAQAVAPILYPGDRINVTFTGTPITTRYLFAVNPQSGWFELVGSYKSDGSYIPEPGVIQPVEDGGAPNTEIPT